MLYGIARLWLWAGAAASIQAQADPENLLARVRATAEDTYRQMPNYMCTQTVDRTEFVGESKVTFGRPGAVPATGNEPLREPARALPDGLPFQLILTQDIPTATAAAGDRISAELVTAIKDKSHHVLVPAGTSVQGRILRIHYDYLGTPAVTILFRLETVEVGGSALPFRGTVESKVQNFDRWRGELLRNVETGDPEDLLSERGVAKLKFWGVPRDYVVKSGMESNWVTGTGGGQRGRKWGNVIQELS